MTEHYRATADAYRRGELLACVDCATDVSSVARAVRTFDDLAAPVWCDYCGRPLADAVRHSGALS